MWDVLTLKLILVLCIGIVIVIGMVISYAAMSVKVLAFKIFLAWNS